MLNTLFVARDCPVTPFPWKRESRATFSGFPTCTPKFFQHVGVSSWEWTISRQPHKFFDWLVLLKKRYLKCYNLPRVIAELHFRFFSPYLSAFERNNNQTIWLPGVFFWSFTSFPPGALRPSCRWSYAQSADANDPQ